eukprot:365028-Chlamydomonas_euryale.AAC.17
MPDASLAKQMLFVTQLHDVPLLQLPCRPLMDCVKGSLRTECILQDVVWYRMVQDCATSRWLVKECGVEGRHSCALTHTTTSTRPRRRLANLGGNAMLANLASNRCIGQPESSQVLANVAALSAVRQCLPNRPSNARLAQIIYLTLTNAGAPLAGCSNKRAMGAPT